MTTEFEVYTRLLELLQRTNWQIICASPPGGTNGRFRKCIFPRRKLGGSEKGPRDEVDLIAYDGEDMLIIECKPRLSDSVRVPHDDLEDDYTKLKRIGRFFSVDQLISMIYRICGVRVEPKVAVTMILAVGEVDRAVPPDMTVLELGVRGFKVWKNENLAGRLRSH